MTSFENKSQMFGALFIVYFGATMFAGTLGVLYEMPVLYAVGVICSVVAGVFGGAYLIERKKEKRRAEKRQ